MLAAGASLALPGCFGDSTSNPTLQVWNTDDESHTISVTVTGEENDRPVLEYSAELEPEESRVADRRIDISEVQGGLILETKIDDREVQRTEQPTGFTNITASINDEGRVKFTRAVQ